MGVQDVPGIEQPELIARGGVGQVYKAFQRELDRWVAVKLIPLPDEASRRRFDRERKAMGRLSQHPSIATILESGTTPDGFGYLLMPYYSSGSLQDLIDREGAPTLTEAVELVLAVASAVDHAHSAGIWHLDLKPSNVLIGENRRPYVADFGLATLIDEGQVSQLVAASPAYASPEALTTGVRTERSDVYGLGATLFTALTGKRPYAEGPGTVVERVLTQPVPEMPGVPGVVAEVVHRAMARAPEDRWPSVGAFMHALSRASGVGAPAVLTRRRGWARIFVWLAAAVTITAVGALVGANGQTTTTTAAASPSETLTATTSPTFAAATTVVSTAPSTTLGEPEMADIETLAVPLGGIPGDPVIDGDEVWVIRDESEGPGSLVRIDRRSGAVSEVIRVGRSPRGPVVTAQAVWVFNVADGTVSVVDRGNLEQDLVELRSGGFEVRPVIDDFDPQLPVAGHGAVWFPATVSGRIYRVDETTRQVIEHSIHAGVDIPGFDGYIATPLVTEEDVWVPADSDACAGCFALVWVPGGDLGNAETLQMGTLGGRPMTPIEGAGDDLVLVSRFVHMLDPTTGAFDQVGGLLPGVANSVNLFEGAPVISLTSGEMVRVLKDDGFGTFETFATVTSRIGPAATHNRGLMVVDRESDALVLIDVTGEVSRLVSWDGLRGAPVVVGDQVWVAGLGEILRFTLQDSP